MSPVSVGIYLTTTGNSSTVSLTDLGNITFTHPTTDFDLLTHFELSQIVTSESLTAAINAGDVTISDQYGKITNSAVSYNNPSIYNASEILSHPVDDSSMVGNTYMRYNNGVGPQGVQGYFEFAVPDPDPVFIMSAGKDNNVSDSYLNGPDGPPSNEVPRILPFNATLIAMSSATGVAETWIAEIHLNLTLVPGAFLSTTAAATNYSASYDIDFNAGDGVQFYVNGASVSKPIISAFFKRRP